MSAPDSLAKVLTIAPPAVERPSRAIAIGPHRTFATVLGLVANYTGQSVAAIIGPSTKSEPVQARHLAMLVCWQLTGAPQSTIGRIFNRDHRTAGQAIDRVQANPAHPLLAMATVIRANFEAAR